MKDKKRYSPAVVAGMTVATIAGVAFAVWNVSRTMSPPSEPVSIAATPPANAPAPGTATAAPLEASAETAVNPVRNARRMASSESTLAPQADPFAPLAVAPLPPIQIQQAPVHQPVAVMERPLPGMSANFPISALYTPIGARALDARPSSAVSAESVEPPALIGTLTGQQPSAVFRSKDGVLVVAAGKSIGPWKVARVVHGGVVLVNGKRRVTVGTSVGGAVKAAKEAHSGALEPQQFADVTPLRAEKTAPAETYPNPFLIAEAANVPGQIPGAEPTDPAPAPSPAPNGDSPAPTPPVIHETAPPPKPGVVPEDPKKHDDGK